ncbi:MAG: group 1 truncated hemoglobin [Sphingobacteriia bacterium]|nr:group 1 truncated hemoglobin [Sphingobacteriia bacterium]
MKKLSIILAATFFAVSLLSLNACKKTSDAVKPTLYDSLGGTTLVADPTGSAGTTIEKGRLLIRSIIDSTIFVIAGDTAINGHFTVLLSEVGKNNYSGFMALSKNLTDFVAVATGAKNFTYGGKSMVAAHDPAQNARMNMKADNSDFNAFENDLVKGAAKNGVTTSNPALVSVANLVESLRSKVVQQ